MVGLRLVALGAMALARRAPRPASVVWRLALANLSRPGRADALGGAVARPRRRGAGRADAGRFQPARAIAPKLPGETPSFYFLDVRSGEVDAFRRFLADHAPAAKIVEAPMMRGRIVRIGDTPAAEVKAKESAAWALEGDRGVTFAATPPEGSKIVAGRLVERRLQRPAAGLDGGRRRRRARRKLGDAVTLNVLGREVTARVANLRRVDWRSFAINFVFVFSPNTFKGAPYTGLFTAALPPADGDGGGKRADEGGGARTSRRSRRSACARRWRRSRR